MSIHDHIKVHLLHLVKMFWLQRKFWAGHTWWSSYSFHKLAGDVYTSHILHAASTNEQHERKRNQLYHLWKTQSGKFVFYKSSKGTKIFYLENNKIAAISNLQSDMKW